MEQLAFNAQQIRGSRDSGHAPFRKIWPLMTMPTICKFTSRSAVLRIFVSRHVYDVVPGLSLTPLAELWCGERLFLQVRLTWPAGLDLWLEELDPTELNLDTWDLTLDLLDSTTAPSSWPFTSVGPFVLTFDPRDLIRASRHLDPRDLTVYSFSCMGHFRTVHGNMLTKFEARIFNHVGAISI